MGCFDRVAPTALHNYLDAYTRWVGELARSRNHNAGMRLARQWGFHIGLNLLLVTAVFIAAVFMKGYAAAWLGPLPGGENGLKAILWLAAMVVSLPMLIAVIRKLQAMGMLVSEMSVSRAAGGENTVALRAIVSSTVFIAGLVALLLCLLLLSSAILPTWNVFLVLALILFVAVILLRRMFIKIHSKAQIALRETLSEPAHQRQSEAAPRLPPTLAGAELIHVVIEPDSAAAGRLIGELDLRTSTGASIVGIDRAGENIINPGPDEELQPGDRVVLLGTPAQLDDARAFLKVTRQT